MSYRAMQTRSLIDCIRTHRREDGRCIDRAGAVARSRNQVGSQGRSVALRPRSTHDLHAKTHGAAGKPNVRDAQGGPVFGPLFANISKSSVRIAIASQRPAQLDRVEPALSVGGIEMAQRRGVGRPRPITDGKHEATHSSLGSSRYAAIMPTGVPPPNGSRG